MVRSIEALATSFTDATQRPAVFDRSIREHHALWFLDDRVPIGDLVELLSEAESFREVNGCIRLPLHKPDSPEVTGEYLEYRSTPDEHIRYFDFSQGSLTAVSLDEIEKMYPAWRLRFWVEELLPVRDDSQALQSDEPAAEGDRLEHVTEQAGVSAAGNGAVQEGPPHPVDADDVTQTGGSPQEDTAPATGTIIAEDVLDTEPGELIQELKMGVEREMERVRDDHREKFSRLSISQYRSIAGGIGGLESTGIETDEFGQQYVNLKVPAEEITGSIDFRSEYGLFPGQEVLVGKEVGDFQVEAELVEISGRTLQLGVYWNRVSNVGTTEDTFQGSETNEFSVGTLLNPVPYDRQHEALDWIAENPRKSGLLTGDTELEVESSFDVSIRDFRLNDSQFRAAKNALRAKDVFCIHGPPGTGKTRTLVELIRGIAAEGHRVLATAHSNQAVDNLLVGDSTTDHIDRDSLHGVVKNSDISVARSGSNSTNELVNSEYVDRDLYQSDVVCATTSGAHQFGPEMFDFVIVDEATQATIQSTVLPLTRGEQLILAGDHKQLPPYHSAERDETEEFELSLFEHLIERYGNGIVATLQTQYRMNREIAAFPNKTFYGNTLEAGDQNAEWTLDSLPPLEALQVNGDESQSPSNSYYNEREISVVTEQVDRLLSRGIPPHDIGIIAPYNAQISKIRSRLAQMTADTVDIKVSTIDAFQGSEREAIIVSFVRSNPQGFSGFLTFPEEGPRRLNVALTRAKRRLVLVGNFDTLSKRAPTKEPHESSADTYQALESYLIEQGVMSTVDDNPA